MENKQKLFRVIITAVLSTLFSVLIVVSIAGGVSYIKPGELRVEGLATVEGGSFLNTAGAGIGLITRGDVGIGDEFFGENGIAPTRKLDVRGDINFTGDLLRNGSPFSAGGGAVERISGSSCPSGEFLVAKRAQARTCTGNQTGQANPPPGCQATSCTTSGGWLSGSASNPTCSYRDAHWDPTDVRIDSCSTTFITCTASVNEVACIGD